MVAKTVRKKKTSETVKQELVNSIKEDDDLAEVRYWFSSRYYNRPNRTTQINTTLWGNMKTPNKRLCRGAEAAFKEVQGNRTIPWKYRTKKYTVYFKIGPYTFFKKYPTLYVLIMSRAYFTVNPHSIVTWISRNFLLEAGACDMTW